MKRSASIVRFIACGACLLFLLACWSRVKSALSDAKDRSKEREVLKGLHGVAIIVEDLASEAARPGLTKDKLQTEVESRLRKAGIPVLTEEQNSRANPSMPFLYITLETVRSNPQLSDISAFSIHVQLNEVVALLRGKSPPDAPRRLAVAPTYTAAQAVVLAGDDTVVDIVRQTVADAVDVFRGDYLAANPKE